MKYLSVCSGIEAATQAWHPMGWQPVAFSEIDPFPCAVLKHHYPDVPNWGDMTKFQEWPDADVDVLCGGTPCQSFSVAGLRKGLADPRGNLMLTFGAIAARYRPRWLVWENVPGVLSSNGGRDFGAFLGMLGQLGYGVAYRVLDAQHVRTRRFPFAVPQRRRRVFVVGYLGDWRRAAAVLFDRESLSGHPPPRREAGQRASRGFECGPQGGGFTDLAPTLDARCKDGPIRNQLGAGVIGPAISPALKARDSKGPSSDGDGDGAPLLAVAHALRGEGFDASEDGTGRGTPIVPVAYRTAGDGAVYEEGNVTAPLTTGTDQSAQIVAIQEAATRENPDAGPDGVGVRQDGASYTLEARQVPQAVAFDMRGRDGGAQLEGPHDTANIRAASGGSSRSYVAAAWQVRRLTPVECERLQAFPDNFTRIPSASSGGWRDVDEHEDIEELRALGLPIKQKGNKWRVKDPDGPRYKALGNSWAVNVAEWVSERMQIVDEWEATHA